MNSPCRIHKILITIGLVVILSTVITFSFVTGTSWANSLVTPMIDQSHVLVTTINQASAINTI